MEWLEIRATTVESAKEQALVHLGVDESDAEFEVLSEPRMGLFGRIKQEARVRARVLPAPVRPKDGRGRGQTGRRAGSSRRSASARALGEAKPESTPRSGSKGSAARDRRPPVPSAGADKGARQRAQSRERGRTARPTTEDAKAMTISENIGPSLLEQADLAESFVRGIAGALDIAITFKRHDLENGIMRIEANGEGVGVLVGRRGGTAQAIDELVRTVLQRSGGTTREGKIRVDVGGVRSRRASALAVFARKIAEESVETQTEIALEPMNRMDRKIVHDVISGIDKVESRSEGEDPHRRVVIAAVSE